MKTMLNPAYSIVIYCLILIQGCSGSDTKPVTEPTSNNPELVVKPLSSAPIPDRISDKINFSWGTYKLQNNQLLNCGKNIQNLWRDSADGFHYKYCLFNGASDKKLQIASLKKDAKLVEFTVWMSGNKIGNYNDTVNEKLVAVICQYSDDRLKAFNLVNKTIAQTESSFGKPDSTIGKKHFYFSESEVLCLKAEQNKVIAFYWLKLQKEIKDSNNWKKALADF